MKKQVRCSWAGDTQIYIDYHDNEWGRPVHDDIKLFKKYVSPSVKIKAAGGIHTLEDAAEFLSEGADRLGTSAIVGIAEKELDEN